VSWNITSYILACCFSTSIFHLFLVCWRTKRGESMAAGMSRSGEDGKGKGKGNSIKPQKERVIYRNQSWREINLGIGSGRIFLLPFTKERVIYRNQSWRVGTHLRQPCPFEYTMLEVYDALGFLLYLVLLFFCCRCQGKWLQGATGCALSSGEFKKPSTNLPHLGKHAAREKRIVDCYKESEVFPMLPNCQ